MRNAYLFLYNNDTQHSRAHKHDSRGTLCDKLSRDYVNKWWMIVAQSQHLLTEAILECNISMSFLEYEIFVLCEICFQKLYPTLSKYYPICVPFNHPTLGKEVYRKYLMYIVVKLWNDFPESIQYVVTTLYMLILVMGGFVILFLSEMACYVIAPSQNHDMSLFL